MRQLWICGVSQFMTKKFKYVRLEASVPIVGVFRKNCAHAKIIRMLYKTLAERYEEEVMIIIRK